LFSYADKLLGFKKRFASPLFVWQIFSIKAKRVKIVFSLRLCAEASRSAIGDYMSKLRVALVVLGDAMLVAAIVLLLEIDKLVNGTLYSYGLVFSDNWAQPYWLMFRLTLVLIVAAVILISVVELPYPAFEERTEEEA
jgi:hypothetical protein